MSVIQTITDKKTILAIVFRHSLKANGVKFLTPQSYPLQIGLLEHPTGKPIRVHRHRNLRYKVNTTQEFIYVESGEVEATIYRNNWTVVKKVILKKGDFILSVAGGHGFKVRKKCRMIEIKQGPYPGDKLAKIFKPNSWKFQSMHHSFR